MNAPLLSIDNLSVRFGTRTVVHDLSLALAAGERVALVGESGSGKSVTALSILRLAQGASHQGRIRLGGLDLLQASDAQLRAVRGRDVAMIFQEPMSALNPLYTIGNQVAETLMLHEGLDARAARQRTIALLERTGIREPERRVDCYPHQLSGGQRQRAMIAMALACQPRLLIADEPTTALDVTIRARIVELLLQLQRDPPGRNGQAADPMAVLLITHDLHLVRRFAQRVAVMERGRIVEVADTATLFASPRHPYTRRLLDSIPVREVDPVPRGAVVRLRTQGLQVRYERQRPGVRNWFRRDVFQALDGVDLCLRAGETVGVVGESGSGKTTLAMAVLGLQRAAAGRIEVGGQAVTGLSARQNRALRARLQVVFQDPFGSLSPRQTVARIVGEGLALHHPHLDAQARRRRVAQALADVGLGEDALQRYPHQFSGGQRQRIAIARALFTNPRILILDEATSALDYESEAIIQRNMQHICQGRTVLIIAHRLSAVRHAHRIIVMDKGHIVEAGPHDALIQKQQGLYAHLWRMQDGSKTAASPAPGGSSHPATQGAAA